MSLAVLALLLLAAARGAAAESIFIKGGTVVNADRKFRADVLVKGELIEAVGLDIEPPPDARVIDASGSYVVPGGIDPHTHLEMPFMGQVSCDDFYSGHSAALAGGTTFHIDFALPVEGSPVKGMEEWHAKAAHGAMDYGLHVAITGWEGERTAEQMAECVRRGTNSFKFFMAYKGALMVTDEQLVRGFRACRALGALAQVHAENGDAVAEGQAEVVARGILGPEGHALSRPKSLEVEATGRAIALAGAAGVPLYVVHVMSGDAAELIARARTRGQRVVGEAVAAALVLDESKMWDRDWATAARFVMSPPLRSAEDRERVTRALAGGALEVCGTDHAAFDSAQKAAGRRDFRVIPNGVNGIEERMHVVWDRLVASGLAAPQEFVRATSTAAAKAFNLYPRKGHVAPGSDADLAVLDPRVIHAHSADTHHSNLDANVFEGVRMRGKVTTTISRGRLVWHDGFLNATRGSARFVPTPPFGPLFDGLEETEPYRDFAAYGQLPVRRQAAPLAAGVTHDGDHGEL